MMRLHDRSLAVGIVFLLIGCVDYFFVEDEKKTGDVREETSPVGINPLLPIPNLAGGTEIGNPMAGGTELGNPYILEGVRGGSLAGGVEIGNPILIPEDHVRVAELLTSNEGGAVATTLRRPDLNFLILVTDAPATEVRRFDANIGTVRALLARDGTRTKDLELLNGAFELTGLTGLRTVQLAAGSLPAGMCHGVELVIDGSTTIKLDTLTATLTRSLPVRVLADFTVERPDQVAYVLVLDFSPQESVVPFADGYDFRPAITVRSLARFENGLYQMLYPLEPTSDAPGTGQAGNPDPVVSPVFPQPGSSPGTSEDPGDPSPSVDSESGPCDEALPCCESKILSHDEFCRNAERRVYMLCEEKVGDCGGKLIKYEQGQFCDGVNSTCPGGEVITRRVEVWADCSGKGLACYDKTRECTAKPECP